jgi:hypothetical protein
MDSHDAGTPAGTGDTGPGRGHARDGIEPPAQGDGQAASGAPVDEVAPHLVCHPVGEALDTVTAVLAGVAGTPLWSLDATDTAALLVRASHVEAALAALRLGLVAHAETAGVPALTGAPSLAAWCRGVLRQAPGTAAADLRLARAVTGKYTRTGAALAAGTVTAEQARAIVRACDALPSSVVEVARADAEAHLIELAVDFDPVELARLGRRVLEVVAPEEADRLLGEQLERDEAKAASRVFHRRPDGHGGCHLSGHLDPEAAALLDAALDPLAAPRPATDEGRDNRSAGRRNADALTELARRALTGSPEAGGPLPESGGEPTTLVVTIGLQALTSGLGPALLPTGDLISARQARCLACNARVIPAVLDGAGQPLDLGRARRLFTPAQRRALILRDGGCAFPGCDRPPSWCEGHHCVHWADGGPTDLGNAVLLCGHHHRLIHNDAWQMRIAADRLPEFIPPAYIDPHRRPRRNTRRHHRRAG